MKTDTYKIAYASAPVHRAWNALGVNARPHENSTGTAIYFEIGDVTVRLADHPRGAWHSGCRDFDDEPDIHLVICDLPKLLEYLEWQIEYERRDERITPFIPVGKGNYRRIRQVLAAAIRLYRRQKSSVQCAR